MDVGAARCRPAILLADDDVTPENPLVRVLTLEGLAVDCVQSGSDALARGLEGSYDAILLDLHLPELPGLSVLEALRKAGVDTPVVAITGWYLDQEHEREARALGACEYLYKPLDGDDVVAALRPAVELGQRAIRSLPDDAAAHADIADSAIATLGEPSACQAQTLAPVGIDRGATEFITERLSRLQRALRRAFPRAPDDMVAEAVEDALLESINRGKGAGSVTDADFERRVYQASWRNVANQLRSEVRRHVREAKYSIDVAAAAGIDESTIVSKLDCRQRLRALASTTAEALALLRWLRGAGPDAIAEALGLSRLTASEQGRAVNRFKNRIVKRAFRRRRR